jgi:aquaporin Z
MVALLLTECVGTFFLVLTILMSGQPIAIGLMLAIMIYIGGHISGGHYNPAITLAVWLRGKLNTKLLAPYMLSQLVGAFIAAALNRYLTGKILCTIPASSIDTFRAITIETLGTFVLCATVLAVATNEKLKGNFVYGFAIGLSLTTIIMFGSASGGAFNPAVGTGPILFDFIINGPATLKYLIIYLTGPFIGGLLSALFYKYTTAN